MPLHVNHTELVEYRQRIAKLNMARDEAMSEEMKLRRWLNNLGTKYSVQGMHYNVDPETGIINVQMEAIHYEAIQSMDNSEKIAAGRNVWTETEEEIEAATVTKLMESVEKPIEKPDDKPK
jgi:predicted RNase H-like nuclease (RuvC/YqgF family)